MKLPHYHHGNLKESLIYHGLDLLEEQGRDQLSLRDIARRAGVSHNAPYRHFPDKSALLMAIQNRVTKELIQHIESVPLLYPTSALLQLQSIGQIFLENCYSHPQRTHLLLQAIPDLKNGLEPRQLIEEAILFVVAECLRKELLNNVDAPSLTQTFAAALFGFSAPIAAEMTYRKNQGLISAENSERFSQFDRITQNILQGFLPQS